MVTLMRAPEQSGTTILQSLLQSNDRLQMSFDAVRRPPPTLPMLGAAAPVARPTFERDSFTNTEWTQIQRDLIAEGYPISSNPNRRVPDGDPGTVTRGSLAQYVVDKGITTRDPREIGAILYMNANRDALAAAIAGGQPVAPAAPQGNITDTLMLAVQHHGGIGTNSAIRDFVRGNADIGWSNFNTANTPWCAAFMNALLEQCGVSGTGSAAAQSFLENGVRADRRRFDTVAARDAQAGDMVILDRGGGPGSGHVGLVARRTVENGRAYVYVLGGNQGGGDASGTVNVRRWPESAVMGYRRLKPEDQQRVSAHVAEMVSDPAVARTLQRNVAATGGRVDASYLDQALAMAGNVYDRGVQIAADAFSDVRDAALAVYNDPVGTTVGAMKSAKDAVVGVLPDWLTGASSAPTVQQPVASRPPAGPACRSP